MSEELFASCYVDENIPLLFVQTLRKQGFIAQAASELGNIGLTDVQQLQIAIDKESVLITLDKNTFTSETSAGKREHCGIIVLLHQIPVSKAAQVAKEVIKAFLNRYTKDEWKNMIVQL